LAGHILEEGIMKLGRLSGVVSLSLFAALLAEPKPAHAGDLSGAALWCLVDTNAWDLFSQDYCASGWTPWTAPNPTVATFEVQGHTAGNYTFTWSHPSCGNYHQCSVGIMLNQTVTVSVQVRDNQTGATKTVSATAEFFDAWN
jgi:hypothetical protein